MTTLIAFKVPPQQEWKAARELREAGIKAYVPRDHGSKRKAPIARGYVFSNAKPAFAKHVKAAIGPVSGADLARLYLKRQAKLAQTPRFSEADAVRIKAGPFEGMTGTLTRRRNRTTWLVSIPKLNASTIAVQISNMIHVDPG